MRVFNQSRLLVLFSAIAGMLKNPLKNKDNLKTAKREVHYAYGGGNPVYIPRRKKLKGWQRELKRK